MRHYRTVLIIGIIEILIGGFTLLTNFGSIALNLNRKSPNVLLFVVVASSISTLLGVGILRLKKVAYQWLLYFSSVILLSKLMIFMGVIHLNGALETAIPGSQKNLISVVYHAFIIYYLCRPEIKKIFHD